LLLGVLWLHLLPLLIGAIAVNVIVRSTTDRRIGAAARAFRQLAPLIATAQGLAFLSGNDIDQIVGPIRFEAPRLTRLKTIARWVSGDPFMLSANATTWLSVAASDLA